MTRQVCGTTSASNRSPIARRFFPIGVVVSVSLLIDACTIDREDPATAETQSSRPNIVLIMADDLGYTDIGAFGSEIRTPNIDALAATGLSLTNFYAAPTCSPARAMLLAGMDNHFTGFGTMAEHTAVNQRGQPGFEGMLSEDFVTVATLLNDSGYHTYLAGKWHIGQAPGTRPHERGFERSFALMQGGASHFSDMKRMLSVYPETVYLDDGVKVESLPDDFYSSAFYTDRIIENIEANKNDGAPFFAWLAFTAPHWPLQVPAEYLDLYDGVYDEGYDTFRQRRLEGAQASGLVPSDIGEFPRLPRVTPWDELSDEEQRRSARTMEIYAAMVERLDSHVGRLIDYLRDNGLYENTLIIFMSDNGAEGNDRLHILDNETWVPANHDLSYANMGRIDSYAFQGPGWGQVSSAPLRLFKAYVTDGGMRVPMIVNYEGHLNAGSFNTAVATIQDLAPTFLELAQAVHPGTIYQGREIRPMTGRSLLPLLTGRAEAAYGQDEALGWELFGHRAIRLGDWKLLWADGKNGSDTWQLYDIAGDPREVVDLAAEEPERLQEMIALWEEYAAANNVILPIGDIGSPN